MTAKRTDTPLIRALARESADRAAGALSQLLGRECEPGDPRLVERAQGVAAAGVDTAIAFELEGSLAGVVALLLTRSLRDEVLAMLGAEAHAESALCEVGNIVASHAVSALADRLGDRITISIPKLLEDDAASALERMLAYGPAALVTATELVGVGPDADALLILAAEPEK